MISLNKILLKAYDKGYKELYYQLFNTAHIHIVVRDHDRYYKHNMNEWNSQVSELTDFAIKICDEIKKEKNPELLERVEENFSFITDRKRSTSEFDIGDVLMFYGRGDCGMDLDVYFYRNENHEYAISFYRPHVCKGDPIFPDDPEATGLKGIAEYIKEHELDNIREDGINACYV